MKIYFKDQDQQEQVLEVMVGDNSYRNRQIMGDDSLTLYFSMPGSMQDRLRMEGGLPLGAWCDFQGERYTLERPENFKMHNPRNFEYTMVMEGAQAALSRYMFRNTTDKRVKFSLTAKPHEHLEMLVKNLCERDKQWTVGECVEGAEKSIAYNHTDCMGALSQMAEAFDTEWEIDGKTIHLRKAEYNFDAPLSLSYGRGNGFKPGVGRTNFSDSRPLDVLYVQGGEKNIDPSVYGNKELLLPRDVDIKYDGKHFEGEPEFLMMSYQTYRSDELGLSVRRVGGNPNGVQGSIDLSHIYPHRVGTVSKAKSVVPQGFCNFYDDTIPEDLDFSIEEARYKGERMTVIFQSGMLAGKEFEILQNDTNVYGYHHDRRMFEVMEQMIDGQPMPRGDYMPKKGDTYAVFGVALPDAYIRSDEGLKSGAEWEMMKEAVRYLSDNQVPKFSFTGEMDGIWAKKNWLEIGGKVRTGGYVSFSDERFQYEPVLIRIVGVKQMINNPHSPQIELSNAPVSGSAFRGIIRKIDTEEVVAQEQHSQALQFTKRRFSDAQQTAKMLEGALLNFSESVNPISVNTMQLLLGDESLQFQFVNNKSNPDVVTHNVTYDMQGKKIKAPAGILQHMTLGVNLTSAHKVSDYQFWDIPSYESPALDEPQVGYYLYVLCQVSGSNNRFLLSKDAKTMDSVEGYYCFLYGVVNSEFEGERSFVPLNGFTEITPGRLTVPMIVSPDGKTYFDVAKGKIGGNFEFLNAQGKTTTLIQGGKLVNEVINTDTLEARVVNTRLIDGNDQSVGAGVMMGRGSSSLKVYDLSGKIRINLQGGVENPYVPRVVVQNIAVNAQNVSVISEYSSLTPNSIAFDYTNPLTNATQRADYSRTRVTYYNGLNDIVAKFARDGIKLPPTATVDMPGVLCAGQISKYGRITNRWGCVTCSAAPYLENGIRKMGYFRIIHSLNHTNYFLQITGAELWNGVEPIIIGTVISKGRNEAIVAISGSNSKTFVDAAFEFCLIGQGKQ